jgi:hypothetical protein
MAGYGSEGSGRSNSSGAEAQVDGVAFMSDLKVRPPREQRKMPGSPRKERGESPQTGAKPGATKSSGGRRTPVAKAAASRRSCRKCRDGRVCRVGLCRSSRPDRDKFRSDLPESRGRCRALPARNAGSPHKLGKARRYKIEWRTARSSRESGVKPPHSKSARDGSREDRGPSLRSG